MTKSTKIVSGLGLVAALSVAAVPVASFATETNYSGQVAVRATLADEIEIQIDGNDMDTTGSSTSGDLVEFMNDETTPTNQLSAGHSYYTGNKTAITVATNVPNTYTLSTSGTALSSTDSSIALAGFDGAASGNTGLTISSTNGATYSGDSMWGIKISGVDKSSNAISLTTDGTNASAFAGAAKYQLGTGSATTIDYAQVTGAKISNTYNVDYGIGINANQSSGVYNGAVYYSVTHIKN